MSDDIRYAVAMLIGFSILILWCAACYLIFISVLDWRINKVISKRKREIDDGRHL